MRETAGECDEAGRKKTVNEAFLEASRDYPPKKKKILGLSPAKWPH